MKKFHKFITWRLCVTQHVSGVSPPITRNCTRNLWFYRWREAAGALLVVVWPDQDQQRSSHFSPTVKPEVPSAAPDDGRGEARNMLSHT